MNSFSSRSKALIWDATGCGVVLPKAGWEVVHLAFVAAGIAWIATELEFITATLTVLDKIQ